MPKFCAFLGGTFDPIHMGHIECARAVLDSTGIDRLHFLLAANPWQKRASEDFEFRAKLIKNIIRCDPRFFLDEREKGTKLTYTIDTLCALRRTSNYSVLFVIGADQWMNLKTWKDWQELTNYANLAVCLRNGIGLNTDSEVENFFRDKWISASEIKKNAYGHVTKIEMKAHKASSTQIRKWLVNYESLLDSDKKMLSDWLTPSNLELIRKSHRYLK